jgi:hypothetical protein
MFPAETYDSHACGDVFDIVHGSIVFDFSCLVNQCSADSLVFDFINRSGLRVAMQISLLFI